MTLRLRLLAVTAAFVVLAGLGAAVVTALTVERDDRRDEETRLVVARELVARLAVTYVDRETGQRGYLITADPTFLEPYARGRTDAARLLAELRRRLRDRPRRRLTGIASAAAAWDRGAEATIATRRTGGTVDSAVLATGKGQFDRLRHRVDRLQRSVDVAADRAEKTTDLVRSRINLALLSSLGLALLGLLAVAVLVRRWVTVPVDAIGAALRRVRAGALDRPVPIVGPPEIAGLARDADGMRIRLSQLALDADRAREAVEQNATVVLALRANQRPDVGDLPPGWSVAADIRAAEGLVAGDCADVARLGEHTLAVLVVDISGHGAIAGILALRCKELLRAALALGVDPGEALASTADQLGELGDETYLSAVVAVIDVRDGSIRYANAGHPPALVCHDDGSADALPPTGPIVGPFDSSWSTGTAALAPGENLAVYTDGIVEARFDGEMFGAERLARLVGMSDCADAPGIVRGLLDAVEAFTPARLQDDATVVVICRAR